jgi:hypothetical protein
VKFYGSVQCVVTVVVRRGERRRIRFAHDAQHSPFLESDIEFLEVWQLSFVYSMWDWSIRITEEPRLDC